MIQSIPDYSTIEPSHFFSSQSDKTKINWFAFELSCEIEGAITAKLKKYLIKNGYNKQAINQSCIKLAFLLKDLILKKLNNEIPEMKISHTEVQKAFPTLNDKTIDDLLTCTHSAWEFLLDGCVSCPVACITNKDEYCEMFDDKSYYGSMQEIENTVKIQRNDPCPCGSGKKYKKCCMDKEDSKIIHTDLFEQENSGTEEATSGFDDFDENAILKATKNIIATQFEEHGTKPTDEELNNILYTVVNNMNTEPTERFLGLSASDVHKILYDNNHEDFVSLNFNCVKDFVEEIPFLRKCIFILSEVSAEPKGIKLTAKGNLPRKIVKKFAENFLQDDWLKYNSNPIERDIPIVSLIRIILTKRGIVKKLHGRMTFTKKGITLFNDKYHNALFNIIYDAYVNNVDWLADTCFNDSAEFIQHSYIFSLFILHKKAAKDIDEKNIYSFFREAFPHYEELDHHRSIEPEYPFTHMFLWKFAKDFGFIELLNKPDYKISAIFKTTPFFKAFFNWKK